jgi:uncharacterized protein (TIGR00725 family)
MTSKRAISVFGGGDWAPKERLWNIGEEAGKIIAESGNVVVTGGYGGAMEAVSEGAKKAGGHTIGILHSPTDIKKPNRFVKEMVIAEDYADRMAKLIRIPFALALPGESGTFAEIAASIALLNRYPERQLSIWSDWWKEKLSKVYNNLAFDNLTWIESSDDIQSWVNNLK